MTVHVTQTLLCKLVSRRHTHSEDEEVVMHSEGVEQLGDGDPGQPELEPGHTATPDRRVHKRAVMQKRGGGRGRGEERDVLILFYADMYVSVK